MTKKSDESHKIISTNKEKYQFQKFLCSFFCKEMSSVMDVKITVCACANRWWCKVWIDMGLQSWHRAGVLCWADVTGKVRTTAHHSLLDISLLCPESSTHTWPQLILLRDGCKHMQLGKLAGHQSCLLKSRPAERVGEKLHYCDGLLLPA